MRGENKPDSSGLFFFAGVLLIFPCEFAEVTCLTFIFLFRSCRINLPIVVGSEIYLPAWQRISYSKYQRCFIYDGDSHRSMVD